MEYTKPWLSYEDQANRLEQRGLVFDRDDLLSRLADIGYYRLSGYWYIFKQDSGGGNDAFVAGTDFSTIWDLYTFDRQLRLLTLDAIERVEIYMRTQLAYRPAEKSGPFGYVERSSLPNLDQTDYGLFMTRAFSAYDRSKTLFTKHFKKKYGDCHGLPPYWMLVNIMDFGMVHKLYKGAPDEVRKGIADEMGIPVEVFESWLLTLNTVRNVCAHHDRLWNRRLGNRVKIPRGRKYPEWHEPYEVNNSSLFSVLTILVFLLQKIAPTTSWYEKILVLLGGRSNEDLERMGFNRGWEECPIWKPWVQNICEMP